MKKNRFIKLASGLLILCLLTACVVGTTLAKYTTANDAQDSARVAKWGVKVEAVTGTSFKTVYTKTDAGYTGTLSVESSSSDNVVAPGTSGDVLELAVSGTPEVAVRVAIALTDVKDITLAPGTYTYADGTTVVLAAYYTPVVFTLKHGSATIASGTLTDIKTAVDALTADDYNANAKTDLSTLDHYTLEWTWAFSGNDAADTLLGDIAAGVSGIKKDGVAITAADYSTEVSYKLTVTVTQID